MTVEFAEPPVDSGGRPMVPVPTIRLEFAETTGSVREAVPPVAMSKVVLSTGYPVGGTTTTGTEVTPVAARAVELAVKPGILTEPVPLGVLE
jgi:uncharacterized spore protein YtfJ